MARRLVVTAALIAALLPVSGAGSAPAQTPKRGGTLVVGPMPEPACLNRLLAKCNELGAFFVIEKVLEPAFDVGKDFTFRPRLVSRVTVTKRPPYTLTYRIRQEARWSDGVPVSASDFVFTHAVRTSRAVSLPTEELDLLARVERVSAVDPKTVRVVLRSRFAGWHGLFPNVLPRHALEGVDPRKIWNSRIDNPRTGRPIGSGPFLFESWQRGRELTLVRNPRYWGSHVAHLDRLVIRFEINDAAPLESFRKDDLDIAFGLFPPQVPPLLRQRDLRVVAPPSASWEHLAIRVGRGGHPALRNPLVRRALAYGIDRVALLRELGEATARPLDSVVFLVQSPYHERSWGRYRHRPALARRLLADAGCRRGADGIHVCAGRRLSLRFVTRAGIPPRQVTLTLIQAQLRRIGIEVVPSYAPGPALFETILPRGSFDVALFGWLFGPNPVSTSPIFRCRGALNYTGYCSQSVTANLDRAAGTLDARTQGRILNRADARMARDVPVLPLFQIRPPTALRTAVKNFAPLPYNALSDAENWWLDD